MATNYTNAHQEPLPAASTLVYTSPTVSDAVIVKAIAFNYGASNTSIEVNIVQSGGSAGSTNKYYSEIVPAGKSLVITDLINEGLDTGDMVYATAGTASSINFRLRIKEITT